MAGKVQHNSFDVALKLRAVEFTVKNGKEVAVRKLDVGLKQIQQFHHSFLPQGILSCLFNSSVPDSTLRQ